jgi:hypothetical protein
METNQVWKSKEARSYLLKILGKNPDGTILVTFDFRLNPRRVHNYTVEYLEQFYEYAGYESVWKIDSRLMPIPPVQEPPVVPAPVEEIDVERVLFTNHTGGRKENVWKEIPS